MRCMPLVLMIIVLLGSACSSTKTTVTRHAGSIDRQTTTSEQADTLCHVAESTCSWVDTLAVASELTVVLDIVRDSLGRPAEYRLHRSARLLAGGQHMSACQSHDQLQQQSRQTDSIILSHAETAGSSHSHKQSVMPSPGWLLLLVVLTITMILYLRK